MFAHVLLEFAHVLLEVLHVSLELAASSVMRINSRHRVVKLALHYSNSIFDGFLDTGFGQHLGSTGCLLALPGLLEFPSIGSCAHYRHHKCERDQELKA